MIPTSAITDEFSPDFDTALEAMSAVGMTGAELRLISGRNIVELSDAEVSDLRARAEQRGMKVLSIASPVLKCVLPGGPPIDPRFQQDVFGSAYTFDDQPRLTQRAFEVAAKAGAGIIRVFSYWRTTAPERCFDSIVLALRALAEEAAPRGIVIGLENEHACNVGTGAEAARMLAAVDHPALKLIWDPANAAILGEIPFPHGYKTLPSARIVHVHAKDCKVRDHKPTWGPLGEMDIDWGDRLPRSSATVGWSISLETHWRGTDGDRLQASIICGQNLHKLVGNQRD